MYQCQLRLSIERFELHSEVAHQLGFPSYLHTASHFVTTVIDILQRCCYHIHMVVGICAAADAKAEEVVAVETVLPCHGIAVGKKIADFTAADTVLKIEAPW